MRKRYPNKVYYQDCRDLIISMIMLTIEDLEIKPYKYKHKMKGKMDWVRGCPKEATKFILSSSFEEICNELDLDTRSIREKLKSRLYKI